MKFYSVSFSTPFFDIRVGSVILNKSCHSGLLSPMNPVMVFKYITHY